MPFCDIFEGRIQSSVKCSDKNVHNDSHDDEKTSFFSAFAQYMGISRVKMATSFSFSSTRIKPVSYSVFLRAERPSRSYIVKMSEASIGKDEGETSITVQL